jgi:molecular chaperone GrpE
MQSSRAGDDERRTPPVDGAPAAPTPAAGESDRGHEEASPARDDLAVQLAATDDRLKRALADLDNYRKRAGREVERRVTEGREGLLRELLEPLDNIERALQAADHSPLAQGLRGVVDQMEALLARHGAQRIGAVGDPFDPMRHEAVAVRETDDAPDGTVVDVARSGFAIGDRVLRPAQVVVAKRPRVPA